MQATVNNQDDSDTAGCIMFNLPYSLVKWYLRNIIRRRSITIQINGLFRQRLYVRLLNYIETLSKYQIQINMTEKSALQNFMNGCTKYLRTFI